MNTSLVTPSLRLGRIRDVVMPKEHGSWSLAFEPVVLGCLVAPSVSGAWLALAVAAGFFARRPLRIVSRDRDATRRSTAAFALSGLALASAAGLLGAVAGSGVEWLVWLLPSAVAGAGFLLFDLRNAGREQVAEVLGAFAFGWLPAAFAALAGWTPLAALALATLMVGRAVPTVLVIRACLRAAKSGTRHATPALLASFAALGFAVSLFRLGALPAVGVVLLALFAARAWVLLVVPRPVLRARTLGMIEAVAGVTFVITAACLAWS